MKRVIRNLLFAAIVLLTFNSCEFDHLHYETNLLVLVRIDVDWSETELTPNGVTAYAYNSNGELHSQELSSNPEHVYLKLPEGVYTIVLHKNSVTELNHNNLEIKDKSNLATATIRAMESNSKASFEVSRSPNSKLENTTLINEPGDVATYTLRGVEILASDVQYHYYKPNLSNYEQECQHIYQAKPNHIIHHARVIVHIANLDNAAGAPTAILRGMSCGYSFNNETTINSSAMEEFKINTRVSMSGEATENSPTKIYVDYNTFGMHTTNLENRNYYLDLQFTLLDGSTKEYHVDVTNSIQTQNLKYRNRHTIEVELGSLPNVSGGDHGDDYEDGTYEPTIDDWVDVEVDLPM